MAWQAATPSAEDDRKRFDLLERLRRVVGEGLLGFKGLTIEVCSHSSTPGDRAYVRVQQTVSARCAGLRTTDAIY